MAKYSKKSEESVHRAMSEMKEGKLESGRSGKKVTSRKQAIAIGLSEARKKGAKVPPAKKKSTSRGTKSSSSGGRKKASSGGRKKSTSGSSSRSKKK